MFYLINNVIQLRNLPFLYDRMYQQEYRSPAWHHGPSPNYNVPQHYPYDRYPQASGTPQHHNPYKPNTDPRRGTSPPPDPYLGQRQKANPNMLHPRHHAPPANVQPYHDPWQHIASSTSVSQPPAAGGYQGSSQDGRHGYENEAYVRDDTNANYEHESRYVRRRQRPHVDSYRLDIPIPVISRNSRRRLTRYDQEDPNLMWSVFQEDGEIYLPR